MNMGLMIIKTTTVAIIHPAMTRNLKTIELDFGNRMPSAQSKPSSRTITNKSNA